MTRKKGFTLIELLVVIAIIALLIGLLLPALATAQKNARTLKDRTQIEQIHTAFLSYANAQKGVLPVPGLINRKADTTIPGSPEMPGSGPEDFNQNRSANLFSSMIAQEYFNTDIVIGPTEVNPNIVQKEDYNYAAYDPSTDKYWDTSFSMNGVGASPGSQEAHCSYAHMALVGKRKDQKWRDNQLASVVVLSTRGPRNTDPTMSPLPADDGYKRSPTIELHGGTKTWEGNICMNDNHVEFLSHFYPRLSTYETGEASDALTRDSIFACEFGVDGGIDGQLQGDNWNGVFKSANQFQVFPIYDPLIN